MINPFLFLFRARDKPRDAVSAATTFSFGTSGSGKPVNAKTAIQVSAVYACVRVIAETVANLPFAVFEQDKSGSQKAINHPLYRILHDEPNPEMTSFLWRETMLTHTKFISLYYSIISATTPEPTVLPPSRIAKRSPFSIAIGVISSTVISTWSPGRHISTSAGRPIVPVTSVVLK